jgi:hypothetical protein
MAATIALTGKTRVNLDLTYSATEFLTVAQAVPSIEKAQTWTSGTGSNQANRYYEETISLAAAAVNRDLYGSLVDQFGNTLSLAKVKELLIVNKSATATETLEISGNFVTGVLWADWVDDAAKITLGPGGVFHVRDPIDGYAVTNTSAERITLDPGANTFDVDLIILGTE